MFAMNFISLPTFKPVLDGQHAAADRFPQLHFTPPSFSPPGPPDTDDRRLQAAGQGHQSLQHPTHRQACALPRSRQLQGVSENVSALVEI